MTDRHTAYFVTLDEPIREDDAKATVAALKQIKGILDVRPVIANMDQMSGAIRMDHSWRNALCRLINEGPKDD